jgi:DNA helicase-2/ATP-dependent DNA helicase PcrA
VNAANRIAELELDPAILIAEAEASGQSFFEHWSTIAQTSESPVAKKLGELVGRLAHSRSDWKEMAKDAIPFLLETETVEEGGVSDVADDQKAWDACMKEIRAEIGPKADLSEILQGLALRSKEPPKDPNAVSLLTVHGSKGLEFDTVYLLGLAEGEMPSWQSRKKGDASPEMEEERRNCFVAITRTQKRLCLSAAKNYRGWSKNLSRFLNEMSIGEVASH